ncbi:MAG: nicotinamide mononucleotide transporter [Abditibacteriota bacterium]|nr:nicotinamide mononucleotide transporter [Abditibacteriota bacterium]
MRELLRSEITGWKWWEVLWLAVGVSAVTAASLLFHSPGLRIFQAVCGVVSVILMGKGKPLGFVFGAVNALLYSWVSWQVPYYGEVALNMLYYVPANVIGFFTWRRYMNSGTLEVIKKKLPPAGAVAVYVGTAAAIVVFGLVLKAIKGSLPFVDATSTVVAVVAMILGIRRYSETWFLWIGSNTVSVIMWVYQVNRGGEMVNLPVVLMWSVFTANSVFSCIRWYREASRK